MGTSLPICKKRVCSLNVSVGDDCDFSLAPLFVFFLFFFYLVQKQTIVSLDTSCYRGVPLKANLWFAV